MHKYILFKYVWVRNDYLILDWIKQPVLLWAHFGAAWFVAFLDIVFLFFATICYSGARGGV